MTELIDLLADPPADPDLSHGYLDLLGEQIQAGPSTGSAQRLMRTRLVPAIYERYWRPAFGRLLKGPGGLTMAGERRFALDALELAPGDVALDVACGTGAFTREFGRAVGPDGLAIGLDASRPMLERAVAATPGPNVAYLRADAVHPPLRDGVVDGVCCYAALHMFADPAAALASFARVLRAGGRLTLLTSARHATQPLRALDTIGGRLSGQRVFERDEIERLLVGAGLDEVRIKVTGVAQFVAARRP